METEFEFMRLALELARQAGHEGEVPVGCVIAREGRVIGRGRNLRESRRNALLHAEIVAIDQACRSKGAWRLNDCQLYVTLEPCPMCAGAIINARMGKVYYGASDVKCGACGGVMNLFEEAFNHRPYLRGGILAQECGALLRDFFGEIRGDESI